jgi:hypothetical protein
LPQLKQAWTRIREFLRRDVIIAVKPLKLDDTPAPQPFEIRGIVWKHTQKMTLRPHGNGYIIGVPTRLRKALAHEMWPAIFQTEDGQVGLLYLADKDGGDKT